MSRNDFFESLKHNKKVLSIGVVSIFGIVFFLIIFSFLLSVIDKKNAVYVKVLFDTNGGTVVSSQTIRKNRTLDPNIKTEKTGFEFIGWEYHGALFDFETKIEKDMVLTARFQKTGASLTHVVTFETYGGSFVAPIEVSEGKTFTKPFDPSKEGYRFLGWYVGEEPYNFLKTAVSRDITLKAKWEKINSVTHIEQEQVRSASLLKQLSGTWYLKGYEDIYLTFTEESNGFDDMWYFIKWYNIDLLDTMELYPKMTYQNVYSSQKAEFYYKVLKFHFELKQENLIVKNHDKEYIFTKVQGSQNKYSNTAYEKAIGRWFLENSYSSYIDITAQKTENILDYDSYCIHSTNINLGTLQLGSSIEYGCRKAYDDSLLKGLNIEINNDVIEIKNKNGIKHFTKNKTAEFGAVTGIKIDKLSAVLENGEKLTLFATVTPKEAKNSKVVWESSDSSIVTVEGNPNVVTTTSEGIRYSATIKAHKVGTAQITVKTIDGNYIATSKITVPSVAVESIILNKKETTIYVGNFEILNAIISPVNASNQNLIWTSSNHDVAVVDTKGKVQGLKEGKATITVSTEDGINSSSCVVNVKYITLNIVTSITDTKQAINGELKNGIHVITTPSGGSGTYVAYQIKLYYNHQLVQESSASTLFYKTELKGTYSAEITVTDSEGHKKMVTKEYIKK